MRCHCHSLSNITYSARLFLLRFQMVAFLGLVYGLYLATGESENKKKLVEGKTPIFVIEKIFVLDFSIGFQFRKVNLTNL